MIPGAHDRGTDPVIDQAERRLRRGRRVRNLGLWFIVGGAVIHVLGTSGLGTSGFGGALIAVGAMALAPALSLIHAAKSTLRSARPGDRLLVVLLHPAQALPEEPARLSPDGERRAAALVDAVAHLPIASIIADFDGTCAATVEPLAAHLEIGTTFISAHDLDRVRAHLDALPEDVAAVICASEAPIPALVHALGVRFDPEKRTTPLPGTGPETIGIGPDTLGIIILPDGLSDPNDRAAFFVEPYGDPLDATSADGDTPTSIRDHDSENL